MTTIATFRLGLVINPLAGLGGSVALKGSDNVAAEALALGAVPMAQQRARQALTELLALRTQILIKTVAGATEVLYQPKTEPTTAADSEAAAIALAESGVDLLLFAGGDGTARNICQVLADSTTVLGIPAGCKIHSGVYAITPAAAGKVADQRAGARLPAWLCLRHGRHESDRDRRFRCGRRSCLPSHRLFGYRFVGR